MKTKESRRNVKHTLSLLDNYIEMGATILEIGCGAAHLCKMLEDRGHRIWSVDIKDFRVSPTRHFALYDGVNLPFLDGSFDIVILAFVLHHVQNAKKVPLLREARRVGNGKLLVLEDTPTSAIDYLIGLIHGWYWQVKVGRCDGFGYYTRKRWEAIFKEADLRILVSSRLPRLCRRFFEPQARSLFVLERGTQGIGP